MPSLSGKNDLSGDNKIIKRLRYFLDEPIDKQFLQSIFLIRNKAINNFQIVDNLGNQYHVFSIFNSFASYGPLGTEFQTKVSTEIDPRHRNWAITDAIPGYADFWTPDGSKYSKILHWTPFTSFGKTYEVFFDGIFYVYAGITSGKILSELGPFEISIPVDTLNEITSLSIVPGNESFSLDETNYL